MCSTKLCQQCDDKRHTLVNGYHGEIKDEADAHDFLKLCFRRNDGKVPGEPILERPSCEELLKHPFVQKAEGADPWL